MHVLWGSAVYCWVPLGKTGRVRSGRTAWSSVYVGIGTQQAASQQYELYLRAGEQVIFPRHVWTYAGSRKLKVLMATPLAL